MFWMQPEAQSNRSALPRHISLRRGTMEDEYATFEVMRRTMGHEMAWPHHAAARQHLQQTACSSVWVAEEKQRFASARIVGYARSVVREGVWCLTEFFVLPGHHRQGIGGALLERCREDGEAFGVDARLILASQHAGADSLYVRKLDCYPRLPMMMLVGPLTRLRAPGSGAPAIVEAALPFVDPEFSRRVPASGEEYIRADPMILTAEVADAFDAMDRRVVGYARPLEHAFWAREMGGMAGASRIFRRAARPVAGPDDIGEIVGYAYLGPHSSGPALAEQPELLPQMLAHVAALSTALANADGDAEIVQPLEQYWALAGTNGVTLRLLLECGWQIVFHYLFMSSRPLGPLDRYVGYNPLYFL
jgi:GNAT superfamily N-acetyltransferase